MGFPSMSHGQRVQRMRAKLQGWSTCGVPFNQDGTPTEPGMRACLKCWHQITAQRAKSYKAPQVFGQAVTAACPGCGRRMQKPPIVRDVGPRPPRAVDPLRKVKQERDHAAAALANWERRLTLSLTKMKQARAIYRRACAKYEVAVAGLTPPKPQAGRRIIVADETEVQR